DLDFVADNTSVVARDADARILDERAGRHVELPAMPGAGDDALGERAFGKRPALMQANAIDGVERAAKIEQRDKASVDGDLAALSGRQVADASNSHEVACRLWSVRPNWRHLFYVEDR